MLAGLLTLAALGATDAPAPLHVLVFTKTAGFRHDSIPEAVAAMRKLSEEHGFTIEHTEDSGAFTDENLKRFDVAMFLLTTGTVFDADQRAAFERFIRAGGGFVGVHSASDTEYEWPWYGRLVGAYFMSHPAVQAADVKVEDREHPSTSFLPPVWRRTDEWYDFRENPRSNVRVLATVDESTYQGGRMGADHPIAWCHEFDGGRSWYTAGGHTKESYSEALFLRHILEGIRWSSGLRRRS